MSENAKNNISDQLAQELLKEKRSERRWKNIRFTAWFVLICIAVVKIFGSDAQSVVTHTGTSSNYTALVRLDGMIAPGREFSAQSIIPTLKEAFEDKKSKGVIIDINSPGGTPVQAAIIHDAIEYYKKKYHKKVIVVGEDMLTSGAYYVAVAADKIYVNPNTLTGSIGVIMKGFGFVDLMKKAGVERRVYTAGTDKDRLDPFLPQNPTDIAKIKEVMGEVHSNFVQAVANGRKGKLKSSPEKLFNGDFWSGETALKLGLVDGLGNLMSVNLKEFNTTEVKEYGGTPNILKLIGGQMNSAFDHMVYTLT